MHLNVEYRGKTGTYSRISLVLFSVFSIGFSVIDCSKVCYVMIFGFCCVVSVCSTRCDDDLDTTTVSFTILS